MGSSLLEDPLANSEAFLLELVVEQLDSMNWRRKFETLVPQQVSVSVNVIFACSHFALTAKAREDGHGLFQS